MATKAATVTVTQIGSPIGRQQYQRQTLVGLLIGDVSHAHFGERLPCVV